MKENNNSTNDFYDISNPVYAYRDLVKMYRENVQVKGFDFDVDMFENLIDNFVPEENIPVILRCTKADLDRFCNVVYHMNYAETYKVLSGVTDMFMRKAIKGLAQEGNQTALKLASEHFMKLKEEEDNNNINITVVNDLNGDDK